jgi:topoisomerase-4 subunit B
MNPDTRRLVQLTLEKNNRADQMLDMLLSKKRAGDRKIWLEDTGNLAEI